MAAIHNPVEARLRPHLEPGETLLWSGQPQSGKSGLDRALEVGIGIPGKLLFVLGFGGMTLFLGSRMILHPTAALFGGLVFSALLFVAVLADFRGPPERARTCYGVTDRRILISWGPPGAPATTSWRLDALPPVRVVANDVGGGAVWFQAPARWLGPKYPSALRWHPVGRPIGTDARGAPRYRDPVLDFDKAATANQAHEIIRAAQERRNQAD